jgi:hypothetical protein
VGHRALNRDVAPDLDLVLLVADERGRDDIDVAVPPEKVGVRRPGVRVELRRREVRYRSASTGEKG